MNICRPQAGCFSYEETTQGKPLNSLRWGMWQQIFGSATGCYWCATGDLTSVLNKGKTPSNTNLCTPIFAFSFLGQHVYEGGLAV